MRNGSAPASSDETFRSAKADDSASFDRVRALPLFDGVDDALVRSMAGSTRERHYTAGTMILHTGDYPDEFQVVEAGIAELCHEVEAGGEIGVVLLSQKDLIVPAAALFREPSLVCARALTPTTTLEIDSESVRNALPVSPQLALNVMKAMSGQWRMAVRNILDLGSRSAAQRLGAFLLRLADIQERESVPVLPIAKRYLAARIGVAPETLSRTLQVVAENGLHLRGRAIIVRDRAQIDAFCGPDPYPSRDERHMGVFTL